MCFLFYSEQDSTRFTAHDINMHVFILLCKERKISVITKMLEYSCLTTE